MPTLRAVDGGNLVADLNPLNVGPANCVQRTNIRRVDDAEVLFPGWEPYTPDLDEPILKTIHARRPNGEKAVLAMTATGIFRFDPFVVEWIRIYTTTTTKAVKWQAETFAGYVCFNNGVDLPVYWDWVGYASPMFELREQGVARASQMWAAGNFLIFGDVTEINGEHLKEWMNSESVDPYGPDIPEDNLTHTQYRVIWTDMPWRWKLGVKAQVLEGKQELILDYPCASIREGDKLNFVETLEDEDDLTVILNEVEVTAIAGRRLTIDQTPKAAATGFVTRDSYTEQIVGYDDLVLDGSAVTGGMMLGGFPVIFKENGIIVGQFTGEPAAPITYEEVYRGDAVPVSERMICRIDRSLFYLAPNQKWYSFDLTSRIPEKVVALEVNETLFSPPKLDPQISFVLNIETDTEVWIFLKERTLVFDYKALVLGELDVVFTAACMADEQLDGSDRRNLLLAEGKSVHRFDPEVTNRNGNRYEGVLKYGWYGSDRQMDTILRHYLLHGEGTFEVTMERILTGDHSKSPAQALSKHEVKAGKSVRLVTRAQYFQESIVLFDGQAKLVAREMDHFAARNTQR